MKCHIHNIKSSKLSRCAARAAMLLIALYLSAMLPGTSILCAQKRKLMNKPYIDQRPYHYGFFAGVNLMDLEYQNNGHKDADGNEWYADVANFDPGFCVGILGELRLNNHFALRAVPAMHFGTKTTTFINNLDGRKEHQVMKTTYISLPIDVKFSAERFNNYRPYIMAGINPAMDLTVKRQKNILLNKFDCFLEVGIGCDFYLPFFKFIPEIKFCYGLSNVINKDRSDLTDASTNIFTESVDRGRSKMIVISFYFE